MVFYGNTTVVIDPFYRELAYSATISSGQLRTVSRFDYAMKMRQERAFGKSVVFFLLPEIAILEKLLILSNCRSDGMKFI